MSYFSIIIPAYNVENYLENCLNSIVGQTFKDYEIILLDDSSTDSTFDIAKDFAERFSFIKIKRINHVPVGEVRNEAIKMSKGKYIVFVDADDYLMPQMLENIHDAVAVNDSDICFLPRHFIESNNGLEEHDFIRLLDDKNLCWNDKANFLNFVFESKSVIPAAMWTSACRKEILIKHGIVFDSDYIWSEDTDFIFKVLQASNTVSLCSYRGYVWNRKNMGSATRNITSKKAISRLSVYKKWYDALDTNCFGELDSNVKDYLKGRLLANYCEMLFTYTFVRNRRIRKEIAGKLESDAMWNIDADFIPAEYNKYGLYIGRWMFMIKHYIKRLVGKA